MMQILEFDDRKAKYNACLETRHKPEQFHYMKSILDHSSSQDELVVFVRVSKKRLAITRERRQMFLKRTFRSKNQFTDELYECYEWSDGRFLRSIDEFRFVQTRGSVSETIVYLTLDLPFTRALIIYHVDKLQDWWRDRYFPYVDVANRFRSALYFMRLFPRVIIDLLVSFIANSTIDEWLESFGHFTMH